MRRGRRKKNVTPRLCSIWEYSVRTEKNSSAQKHIYQHMTLQQGKHIQLWQAAIRSGAIYCGAGRRPARQRGGTKRSEAVDRGRGVIGEGARESPCSALPRFGEPCRESLSIDETRQQKQAGEKKGRTGSEKMRLPPLRAKRETAIEQLVNRTIEQLIISKC